MVTETRDGSERDGSVDVEDAELTTDDVQQARNIDWQLNNLIDRICLCIEGKGIGAGGVFL